MNTYALINSGVVESVIIADPKYPGYAQSQYDSINDVTALNVMTRDKYSGNLYVGRPNDYQTLEVNTGNPINLTCRANGDSLTYQWKKDSVNLSGETASSLNIAVSAAGDAAAYTCEVSDGTDTLVSDECTVTVT